MRDILLCLFFCVLVASGCEPASQNAQPDPPPEAPLVQSAQASYQQISNPIQRAGRLVPAKEVKLSFKSGGIISEILVAEGKSVRQGQPLARLANQELKAQQRQLELAIEQQQKELNRLQTLYADTVITLEQLEKAEAALESRKAQKSALDFNLDNTTIYAPANGKILRRFAEPNELTGPGNPILLFSPSRNQWHLQLQLSDVEGLKVRTGDRASVSFDALPEQTFPARVVQIKPTANPITGTVEVEVLLEEQAPKIMIAGLIGQASIFPADAQSYWTIPPDALLSIQDDLAQVFVLQGDSVLQRSLRIKSIEKDRLIIQSGLDSAVRVITEGKEGLRSGQIVRLP
ncbi:MAG: efflux RND transporter periplasmic adaptor subunit [Bacteroidota bacterium]